jgi:hypothetical protein
MIAVGGIGGSGTRVIAQVLSELGVFIGHDLNRANDNLLFTLLFKRRSVLIETAETLNTLYRLFVGILRQTRKPNPQETDLLEHLASADRPNHPVDWLQERLAHLNYDCDAVEFGFKEPNSHIIIDRLLAIDHSIKYIYVYRNGLDMAFSNNQNQLALWGDIFLDRSNIEVNPRYSLKYWCATHKRNLEIEQEFQSRVFLLNFDQLCLSPELVLKHLLRFLQVEVDDIKKSQLANLIELPASLGRHKQHSLSQFDDEDLSYLRSVI